jgi:hypothetical protein
MSRFHRKIVSLIGIFALLFAQLAGSAYACPFQMQGIADTAMAGSAESDGPTAALDPASPALCEQHCQYGKQSINDAPQPMASVVLAPAFVVTLDCPSVLPTTSAAAAPSRLYDSSPPLSIRNCCFRI